jgi:hypothetical protein
MAFAQSGFVRGSVVLFEDNLANEQVGARPTKWSNDEYALPQVVQVDGGKAVAFSVRTGGGRIAPIMATPLKNLPECLVTIEFDFFTQPSGTGGGDYQIYWDDPLDNPYNTNLAIPSNHKNRTVHVTWLRATTGERGNGNTTVDVSRLGWHRAVISFNRGVMDIYIDGKRIFNESNVKQPVYFAINGGRQQYIRNVVICSDRQPRTAAEMANAAKSSFTPGAETVFEDRLTGERVGAAPSKWSLMMGKAEIALLNGENVISFTESAYFFSPKMNTSKSYLPENYTVELDFYTPQKADGIWMFQLNTPNNDEPAIALTWDGSADKNKKMVIQWTTTGGGSNRREAMVDFDLSKAGWHRLAVSYNQKTLNVFIDGVQLFRAENAARAGWFSAGAITGDKTGFYLRNVRIARSN